MNLRFIYLGSLYPAFESLHSLPNYIETYHVFVAEYVYSPRFIQYALLYFE